MKPDLESSRSFAMVLAHRAVRDIRRDGFRQLRNYVDMCALLARRPDLKQFFDRAQTVLQRTDSLYYSLVHKLVERVDEEAICTVGIDLGLDAIVGCAAARRSGTGSGSWFNAGLCSAPGLDAAVTAAEAAGSYAWTLYADGDVPKETSTLFAAHPNTAFFVLVDPQAIDAEKLALFEHCPNAVTLIYLHQPELVPEACSAAQALREKKMFYGFVAELDEQTAGQAIDPDWLDVLAQYGLFCIYARKPGMTPETSHSLYRQIVSSRMDAVSVPVLLLDWEEDLRYVSRMVTPGTVPGQCVPEGKAFPLDLCCGTVQAEEA